MVSLQPAKCHAVALVKASQLTLYTCGAGLGIPAALIAFALLKCWTAISACLGLEHKAPRLHNLLFKPFLVQENSVMQVSATNSSSSSSRHLWLSTASACSVY